jgi:hypothetical protein
VDDGQQGDRPGRRGRAGAGRSFDRLKLAAVRAVDDVPAALAQLLPDRVGSGEVALAPALDAGLEESLRLGLIRSSSF